MLLIQEYLRTPGKSLETLAGQFAIKVRPNERLGVVTLNYDQIFSDVNLPLVQECRALILELGTWTVRSLPFKRFFNLEENRSPDFNWSSFDTWEKLDGSLIAFWHHATEGWQVSTRSNSDGSNTFDDSGETFKALILRTLKDMGTSLKEVTQEFSPAYCYTCELQTPETQVVTTVHKRTLSLLAVRDLSNLQEVHIHTWIKDHPGFTLPLVQNYPGFTLDAVKAAVQARGPLEHEGYVLMDNNFNRIKVKSAAYILMSSRRDSLGKSNKARVELILSGADDDVMGILPVLLQEKITTLKAQINALAVQIDQDYAKYKGIENQKDFALAVMAGSVNPPAMFTLRKGALTSGHEYLRQARPKSILEWIHVEDDEEIVEEA